MPSPGGDLGQVVTLVVGDLVANQPERYGHTCRSDPIPDLLLDEGGVLIAGIGPVPGDHDDAVDLLGALRERLGEVLHGLGDAPQQGSFAACPDFAGGLGDLLAVVGAKVHELGGVVLGAALTAEAAQRQGVAVSRVLHDSFEGLHNGFRAVGDTARGGVDEELVL